jgi:hypothetical protein
MVKRFQGKDKILFGNGQPFFEPEGTPVKRFVPPGAIVLFVHTDQK